MLRLFYFLHGFPRINKQINVLGSIQARLPAEPERLKDINQKRSIAWHILWILWIIFYSSIQVTRHGDSAVIASKLDDSAPAAHVSHRCYRSSSPWVIGDTRTLSADFTIGSNATAYTCSRGKRAIKGGRLLVRPRLLTHWSLRRSHVRYSCCSKCRRNQILHLRDDASKSSRCRRQLPVYSRPLGTSNFLLWIVGILPTPSVAVAMQIPVLT